MKVASLKKSPFPPDVCASFEKSQRFVEVVEAGLAKIVFSKLLYYSNILLTTIVIYGIPEVSNCESDNRSLVQLGGDRTGQRQHLKTFSEISEINDQFGDDGCDNDIRHGVGSRNTFLV